MYVYIKKKYHVYFNMFVVVHMCVCVWQNVWWDGGEKGYGVATVSKIDKIVGLLCRIVSLL